MLPWARCSWMPERQRLAARQRSCDIRDQPIDRHIAAADHVARPRRSYAHWAVAVEKAAAIAGRDQFCGRLGGAVGVMPAQGVFFAVAEFPLAILVDLIGGHTDDRARLARVTQSVQQVCGTHDIGVEGLERAMVTVDDQRLRG